MFLKIVVAIAVIVASLLTYVALQSPDFKIERDLEIKASADKIFPYINNQSLAHEWMPWKDSDPGVQMVMSGPPEGVGSRSTWDSQGNMGTGEAVVVESVPNRSVKTQLTYMRPMTMSQLAEISLEPKGDTTVVRWVVTGQNSFLGRLACIFFDMDKMVGGEFEKGLAKLKVITEAL